MVSNDILAAAAQELVDRHGRSAVDIMLSRVLMLADAGRWPEHDIAQRVHNEVERLVD